MDGAWVTTQEIIAGYLLAVVVSIPLALAVAYSRFIEKRDLSGDRVPADHPEDRDRAAVHHLVRLRLHAEAAAGVPAVVLPDRGRRASRASSRSIREIMDFARTTGAGGWRMFAKIRLPQALPRHLHRPEGRRRARRRPPRSSPSSSRRTRASATCCCNTTAISKRRWCSPIDRAAQPDRARRLLRGRDHRAHHHPVARLAAAGRT